MPSVRQPVIAPPPPVDITKPQTVAECHQVIDSLAVQIALLSEQLALVQERLSLNSRNSSKPPSSDGPGVGMNREQRRASQRKRGAQKGHPGAWRELLPVEQVDTVHDCPPPSHCECGGEVAQRGKPYRHQVFDIPPVQADVQEYRLYSGRCAGCGKSHRAALPPGVPTGQIGPRALALVGVLASQYQLPQFKVRDLLAHILGVNFSVGAISQAHGKVAQALRAPVAAAERHIAQSTAAVHMDETRYPREGSLNWVWAAVQPKLAVFSILPTRARYVAQSILGTADGAQPKGILVSDRYSAYAFVDPSRRQVCWAHLIRDFSRISQRPGRAGRIGRTLLGASYLIFRYRNRQRPSDDYSRLQRRMQRALTQGTHSSCKRTSATCNNLLQLWPAMWTFVTNPLVAPTNNEAERAIRSLVIKRKISGPTRSRRGEEFLARAFSAMETCRRQGRDFIDFTYNSILAWIDDKPPPSLVPSG